MFINFNEEARKILVRAKVEMKELKHPYVGSEHFLLALLKDKNEISKKLKNYNLTYDNFKKEVKEIVGVGNTESTSFLYTPLLKRVMENAIYDAKESKSKEVTINHLFSSLLEEGEGVAIRIMVGMDIDLDELYHEFSYRVFSLKKGKKLIVEEMGIDLNKKALENEIDPVIGREEEIKRILEILSRRKKNNPILVGDAGVGKTAIVEELSRLIALGDVPYNLKNKRIISLNMSSTVAGTKYRGEFEDRINKMLKELEENDDIILFIDEIHTIVGAGGAEGAIDASNIFKPALARNKMRLIGATTMDEYKKYISEDKALDRRFQKVYIKEPNNDKLKNILLKTKETYEIFHHVKVSDEMIDLIAELSCKYMHDRKQPDKAIDILDEVCAHVSLKENKNIKKYNELNKCLKELIDKKKKCIINDDYKQALKIKEEENILMDKINKLELKLYEKNTLMKVTKKDVIEVVSRKTNIPINKFSKFKLSDALKLKNILNSKIYGQIEAIDALSDFYKQINLGYKDDRPYSFLFVGNTGVGKTMLAKTFAKQISPNVIKLDMSEFSEPHSISKLIGSPAGYVGYNDNKNIFESIKTNPFSIIILDELEKANSNVLNIFFQILDEGIVKDAKGEEISLKNCIIIMTSNVGCNNSSIGFNSKENKNELIEAFSLPFINRIDKIIRFNNLKEKDIKNIINNSIKKFKDKYREENIIVEDKVIKDIIKLSEYELYGARKVKKLIKDKVESNVVEKIIKNSNNINSKNKKVELKA